MKKNFVTSALLALALITAAAPLQAQGPTAKKKYYESLDRFRRCIRGNCTKMEGLRTARDLGLAAALVVAGMYAAGRGAKRIGKEELGERLQAPAKQIGRFGAGAYKKMQTGSKRIGRFATDPLGFENINQ